MMTLLFILAGVICIGVWPWVYLLHVRDTHTSVLMQYAILFGPAAILFTGYIYYSAQQTEIRSQTCGTVVAYQSYMSSGNKNKRQSFERVEMIFNDTKYARHLRMDKDLQKVSVGSKVCFEYYDRKLNPHLKDSVLIQWRY